MHRSPCRSAIKMGDARIKRTHKASSSKISGKNRFETPILPLKERSRSSEGSSRSAVANSRFKKESDIRSSKAAKRLQDRDSHWLEEEVEAIRDADDFDDEKVSTDSENDTDRVGDDGHTDSEREIGDVGGYCDTHEREGSPLEEGNSKSAKRKFASRRNTWNPSALIEKCCYDQRTGLLLSREHCQTNLADALKTKRGIDFYDVLKLGRNTTETHALSFALFMLDRLSSRMMRKNQVENESSVKTFDIEMAREADVDQELPGGKQIKISMLIEPSMCSNWTGKSAVMNAVTSVLKEIKWRDPFFIIYSSPDSDRQTDYPAISSSFVDNFANVLQSGFRMADGSRTKISLAASIRQTVRNYIDKRRREKPRDEVKALLDSFWGSFSTNEHFRAAEVSIENTISSSILSQKTSRRAVLPLKRPLTIVPAVQEDTLQPPEKQKRKQQNLLVSTDSLEPGKRNRNRKGGAVDHSSGISTTSRQLPSRRGNEPKRTTSSKRA